WWEALGGCERVPYAAGPFILTTPSGARYLLDNPEQKPLSPGAADSQFAQWRDREHPFHSRALLAAWLGDPAAVREIPEAPQPKSLAELVGELRKWGPAVAVLGLTALLGKSGDETFAT